MEMFSADPIEQLRLSRRANNALRRSGVSTVGQLMNLSEADLLEIKNLGIKTVNEILCAQKEVHLHEGERPLPSNQDQYGQIANMQDEMEGSTIDELSLSTRAHNQLLRAGIVFISELNKMSEENLMNVNQLGAKTVQEILKVRAEYQESRSEKIISTIRQVCGGYIKDDNAEKVAKIERNILDKLAAYFGSLPSDVLDALLQTSIQSHAEYESIDIALQAQKLWKDTYSIHGLQKLMRVKIQDVVQSKSMGISENEIVQNFAQLPFSENVIRGLVNGMINDNILVIEDGLLYFRFPTILEYVRDTAGDRNYQVVVGRLQGKKLEELGNEFGVQRERIRQIVNKALRGHPKVWENRYVEVYEKYDISADDFTFGFREDKSCYWYLNAVYTKGETPIEGLPDDEYFPAWIRRAGKRIAYRNYVSLGNELVRCKRRDICEYLLRTAGRNEISYKQFTELYNDILKELGLEQDPSMSLSVRGYENKIASSRHVLWKHGQRIRYYDIDAFDYCELFETLDLRQYQNVELSTLKMFRDYPAIMSEYDIRDEYELHNLLKKICTEDEYPQITFKRMPTMEFGIADRDGQIKDLLSTCAPIEKNQFAEMYEETYGIKSQTVLANYVDCIAPYLEGDIYKVDVPALSAFILEKLKEHFTRDFYTTSELVRGYLELFPRGDRANINPYSVDQLGYKIYSSYVISKRYSSASDYFRTILLSQDLVDLTQYDSAMRNLVSFSSELYRQRATYKIVEYHPLKYISINRLNVVGATEKDLRDYCDQAAVRVRDGEYFTIASLRKAGFEHELDDLGFEDWFYASVLVEDKQRFSYRRMGGTRLFRKGMYEVSITELVENILLEQEADSMELWDLIDYLGETYQIKLDPWKLIDLVRNSSMYYDSITEKVYADYDVYFQEI